MPGLSDLIRGGPASETPREGLERVGNFQPRNQRESELARQAVTARRAGDNDAYNRAVAAIVAQRRGNRQTAFTLGAGNGLFGAGDYAAAAGNVVSDVVQGREGAGFSNYLQRQSAIRRAVAERHPVSNALGEVAGVVATLPAAEAASARILTQAPRAVRVAATGAALGGAQGAANRGAETGTVQGAGEGAVSGAAAGAVAGVALDSAARLLAPFLRSVGDRLASDNGLRALSQHVNIPFAELQRQAARFRQSFPNRNPTLAEVAEMANPQLAREAGQIVASRPTASQVATEGAEQLRVGRQQEVAEAVLPGSSTNANVTGPITDRGMARIERAALNVGDSGPFYDFLTRPNVARLIRSMPPEQRARIGDAIENAGRLTVRDLDDLRQAANNASDSGAAYAYNNVAETATNFADRATRGAYTQIIRRDHRANASREEIARTALSSPAGAERAAENLATGAQRQLELVGDVGATEATRLQEVGDVATRAARGVDAVTPTRVRTAADEQAQNLQSAAQLAFIAKSGGAARAGFLARTMTQMGVGPRGAERLARDLTDPARFPDAFARLQRLVGRRGAQSIVDRVTRQYAIRGTVSATGVAQTEGSPAQPQAPGARTSLTEPVRIDDPAQLRQILDTTEEPEVVAQRSDQELIEALYAADAAGDEEGAQILAAAIRQRQGAARGAR